MGISGNYFNADGHQHILPPKRIIGNEKHFEEIGCEVLMALFQ
jgi:hypothetical protein